MLTPQEFFALYDGYERRKSNQEEHEARWVAMLMNAAGDFQPRLTVEGVLGRPLRANWAQAQERDSAIVERLAEKDAARRGLIKKGV